MLLPMRQATARAWTKGGLEAFAALVWATAGCGGDRDPGRIADGDGALADTPFEVDTPPSDGAVDDSRDSTAETDTRVVDSDVAEADTAVDSVSGDATEASDAIDDGDGDAAPDGEVDAADVDAGPDVSDTCLEGDPCAFQGYLPYCYAATCNDRGTCVANKIEGCCLTDVDCPPALPGAVSGACDTVRCLYNTCTSLRVPGCCDVTDTASCDDASALTSDTCDPVAARCESCAPACGFRPPIFAADFDDASATPAALGFFVFDQQGGDAVTWQRTSETFAAGGGAAYLGDPRCHTYYGGALDAQCEPIDDTGQDSARIVVGLHSPFFTLPPESPAMLTAWLRAAVEPVTGLGAGEPDVLRIQVETLGAQATIWTLASTLDLGKSHDWTPIAVDLAAFRGQTIRVRFDFDTLDGENNRYEGVWLDEIEIRESCSQGGCCDDDSDCADPTACTRGACILTSQGAGRVCATIAKSPGNLCTPCASDAACADADPCTNDVCLPSGACSNDTFCCLERDLLAEAFESNLGFTNVIDDDPFDAVTWSLRDGAAWFGDATTGTYGAAGRVSGALVTTLVELPTTLAARSRAVVALTLRLSTEWDLAEPGDLEPGVTIDNPAGLDRLTIEVHDGTFVTPLWSSDQIAGTTQGAPLALELDLAPWLGRTISLHIRFDSGDETLNTFAGPYIDQLAIGLRCD